MPSEWTSSHAAVPGMAPRILMNESSRVTGPHSDRPRSLATSVDLDAARGVAALADDRSVGRLELAGDLLEGRVLDEEVVTAARRGVSELVPDAPALQVDTADRHVVGPDADTRSVREADVLNDRAGAS